jgi:hypothetical protein
MPGFTYDEDGRIDWTACPMGPFSKNSIVYYPGDTPKMGFVAANSPELW